MSVLLLHGLFARFQFLVPCLSELPDERFFQKLIDGGPFQASHDGCCLADIPAVVIDSLVRTVFSDPDRIKMARQRFVKLAFPFTIGFFDGAIATAIFIMAGKDAVFVVDDGSDQVAVAVGIDDALFADNSLGLGGKVVPNNGKDFLQFGDFAFFHGCAGITFDAAGSVTGFQVAEKLFGKDV